MLKRIISTVLAITILITTSCTGAYKNRPSPLMWAPIKIAKSIHKNKTKRSEFVLPKMQKAVHTIDYNNPTVKNNYQQADFEPLTPEEKRGSVIVAVVLVLLIAASIAVPIITLTAF